MTLSLFSLPLCRLSVENDAHPKVQLEVVGGKSPCLLDFGLVRYGVDTRATLKVTNVSQVRV
jgi:hypothetical protein